MKFLITENQLQQIVKKNINEVTNLPDQLVSLPNDPYEYKRENGKYFTKKKTSDSWIDVTGKKYETPIRQKVFKDLESTKQIEKKPKKEVIVQTPIKKTNKGQQKKPSGITTKCIAIEPETCKKISPTRDVHIGDITKGIGCSKYALNCLNDFNEKIKRGHAWTLFPNLQGNKIYNMYDQINVTNVEKLLAQYKVSQDYCKPAIGTDHADKQFPKVVKVVEGLYPQKTNFDISKLKVGDIVGLYLKNSSNKAAAFCERAVSRGINSDYTLKNKQIFTFNTHVGYVGAIKNGVPLIFHSIDGKLHSTPATTITSKKDWMMIVWVVRDPVIEQKVVEREKELAKQEKSFWPNVNLTSKQPWED